MRSAILSNPCPRCGVTLTSINALTFSIEVFSQSIISIGWGYMLMCIIVQSQAVFKAIGMLKTFVASTFISIVFRIALSYLFEHFWGLEGMFWAPAASWIVGGSFCFICMTVAYKKLLLPLASKRGDSQDSGSAPVEDTQLFTEGEGNNLT